jgi:hypothetical protein
MDAELLKFADDLLQSVREMNGNVRVRETKVAISLNSPVKPAQKVAVQ